MGAGGGVSVSDARILVSAEWAFVSVGGTRLFAKLDFGRGLAAVWPAHSHQVNNSSAVLLLFYPIQLQADFETAAGLTALRKRMTG